MTEMNKIWLLAMLDNEIEETNGNIANNTFWSLGSETPEIAEEYNQTLLDLEDYKQTLENIKKKIEEDEFDV